MEEKQPSVQFKVLLRKGAKIQARDLAIPEDTILARKVRHRQSEEEREREEIRDLVLQQAKLMTDTTDEDATFQVLERVCVCVCVYAYLFVPQRLNKAGMQVKPRKETPKAPGPPIRAVGQKF